MSKLTYDEARKYPGAYRLVSRGSHAGDYVIFSKTGVVYINSWGSPPYLMVIEGGNDVEEQARLLKHHRNECQYVPLSEAPSAD